EGFKYPEQAGVIFAGKVVGGGCGGLDALYIPGVEVLVTDQTKEVLVSLAGLGASDGGKVATRCHQGGGRAMLKSTVAVAHDHGHEYIPISRIQKRRPQGRRLEQRNLGLADVLDVGRDALEVEVGQHAGKHQFVLGATGSETCHLRCTHLVRVVDQGVIVRRFIQSESMAAGGGRSSCCHRQAGVDLPVAGVSRRMQMKQAARGFEASGTQKHAGAVEKSMGFVEVRATYGKIPRVDDVFDMKRTLAGGAS